ncbi:MAG: porin family protein [Nitrospira sp.]|nr:porin family protein [Nitrospira sp.]
MRPAAPKRPFVMTVALAIVYGLPPVSLAEPVVSLYGGGAFPQSSTVTTTVQRTPCFICPTSTVTGSRRVNFDSSPTIGGRVGYWVDRVPWFGVAFDMSYFGARASGIDSNAQFEVIPLSFLAMFRVPLFTSENYPRGRMRPYAAVGPSFVLALASTDFGQTVPSVGQEWSKSAGLDIRAGLDWMFAPHLAVFTEYRFFYTHIKAESCNTSGSFSLCFGSNDIITSTLQTHMISAGLAYHF